LRGNLSVIFLAMFDPSIKQWHNLANIQVQIQYAYFEFKIMGNRRGSNREIISLKMQSETFVFLEPQKIISILYHSNLPKEISILSVKLRRGLEILSAKASSISSIFLEKLFT
jgi:hypothetical protein